MIGFTHGIIGASAVSSAVPVSNDFIIKVKTDNAGTSGSNQFTLPTFPFITYNYTLDWGDGVVENHTTNTSKTHTYPSAGTYTIKISGTFPRIHFNNGGDKLKLVETVNFGDVGWVSFGDGNGGAFFGCANMNINVNCTGNFDLVTNGFNAFRGCTSMTYFPAIDMPVIAGIRGMWQGCTGLTSFPLINLSAVTNAGNFSNGAWQDCTGLTSFPAINMPECTIFIDTWLNCSLTSFPVVLLGTNKTNVDFRGTWRNNNFTTFPNLDLSKGTQFGGFNLGTWQGCGVISSFATRNFYGMTSGSNCFQGTTLTTSDYSDILVTQRANNSNNSVTFHGGSSKYNVAGGTARGELVSIQSWSITDGGAE